MTVLAKTLPAEPKIANLPPKTAGEGISWEHFQEKFLSREDGYTYEWTNGSVEKSRNNIDITQLYIWLNLNQFFVELTRQRPIEGSLVCEPDIFLKSGLHRRPDIAFLTDEQIRAGRKDRVQVPKFAVEIISTHDKANKVSKKSREYFENGVELLWLIYPDLEEIHASSDGKSYRIFRVGDFCSAEQVIPDFRLPVSDVFKN